MSDNTLNGGTGNDTLNGSGSSYTMAGSMGDDTYIVDDAGDVVVENPDEGNDTVEASITYALDANVEDLTLTGTGNIDGTGNELDNVLTGNSGDNTLDGRDGADTMSGGQGNDTYIVDNVGDVVSESIAEGIDTVQSNISYSLGTNVENLVLTGAGAINGTGNELDNFIAGNSDDNMLDGGLGADTMAGSLGNDTYVIDDAGDVVTENVGEGIDTVQSSLTYNLGANLENLLLTGTANINGTGNSLNNIIIGNSGSNILDGDAGADMMAGGLGDDTYIVNSVGDVVAENINEGTDTAQSSVTYTLGANVENLTLTGTGAINGGGNTLDNVLTGNSGSNILDGRAGADTMAGGLGNDIYMVDNIGDIVSENDNEGTDMVQSSITYGLGASVENLALTGTEAINGTGNALNNVLTGNSGSNILDGGSGADTMTGGLGDDTYIVDNVGDIVNETFNEGTDTVQSSVSYTLNGNIENLTLTGTEAINGGGNELDNVLIGNSGSNVLDGGAGADTMTGGLGDDTYTVDDAGDIVSENANEGTDMVQSSITYTLGANVENLTLTGTGTINGDGNALDNVLIGNSGSNALDGGAGTDIMAGGLGNDTYVVDNTGDIVNENAYEGIDTVQSSITYTLGANVENLALTGIEAINGTGNALNNVLTGNSGSNILDGGIGADTMTGGLGDDTYVVDNAGDITCESAGEGTDIVLSSVSYTLNADIENLILTGTGAINGAGNALDNKITGNDGSNILDGGAGADTMAGGLGNDTYVVDNVSDIVSENVSEGTDTVQTSITYTLGANAENLTLTGTEAINGVGNALDNIITGNSGSNILDGGAGADIMSGGLGSDTYVIDNIGDIVAENVNEGTDTVRSFITYTLGANLENLTLTGVGASNGTGNQLNNIISGNSGSNILDGGAGADTLAGGLGDDIYAVDNVGDIVSENVNEGTDTVQSSITYTLGANVENLTLTGTGTINGAGNELDNIITGNSGNNSLDGGAGADIMAGGLGDDTYIVDSAEDVVAENTGEGTDMVQSSITYTLGANVENLALTGTGAINGNGNALGNVITGNSGNNILNGGAGNDTLKGGLGDDIYIYGLGSGNDTIDNYSGTSGHGVDTIQFGQEITSDSIDYLQSGQDIILRIKDSGETLTINKWFDGSLYQVESLRFFDNSELTAAEVTSKAGMAAALMGTVSDDNLTGKIRYGIGGNDVLNGTSGNDQLFGGTGNDTYIVNNVDDVVIEYDNEGVDAVQSSVSFTLGANVENLTLTGSDNINSTGNELDNVILGNSGDNVIDGGLGADAMAGGSGNDTYIVENTGDMVSENAAAGNDSVQSSITYALGANVENLTLTGSDNINGTGNELDNVIIGNSGNNILDGGSGNDYLVGGLGADSMAGGSGNDSYIVDDIGDIVTENAGEGNDTVQSSIAYALTANVENLTLTGSDNINGTGNELDNGILGNSGDNVVDGGLGADTMAGGSGNDTYIVENTGDMVTENAAAGVDSVQSSISYDLTANVENLTLTGSDNINGTGNELDNGILGNSGDNVIDGGLGADIMAGGSGNDTYIVDNTGDTVLENAAAGIDSVQSSITYTLTANVENLTLTGSDNINGAGNELDNGILGNSGSNVLDGGAGDDTLSGGIGNDTLSGGSGNDLLDGGLGADIMAGGSGNDIYIIDNMGDMVLENAAAGIDSVQSSISYALTANVENLTLTGSNNINGTGNELDNGILGNSGDNVIDGGLGADTMAGGSGNDTYLVDDMGDIVTENDGEGVDSVQSSITYTLTANVENLTLTGSGNINGAGNELDNVIRGNSGNNVLDGQAGDDTLSGGVGNDKLLGGSGNDLLDGGLGADIIVGGTGNDTYIVDNMGDIVLENAAAGIDSVRSSISYALTANVENLTLTGSGNINGAGNELDNVILGSSGDNLVNGGLGADTMAGGSGNDTYIVENTGDTVLENVDQGKDTVQSSITYTLTDNVEDLILTGSGHINGTGNELDNVISGNSGSNILDGGAGNDTLYGGCKSDTLYGGSGNDYLNGGQCADTMAGGSGADTYVVDNVFDIVVENNNEGIDTIQSSVTYTLSANVENLTLTGNCNINGGGNELDNIVVGNNGNNVLAGEKGNDSLYGGSDEDLLYGGEGNDLLDGGADADIMLGGTGNDTYIVDNFRDRVMENRNEGIDTVQASITYTLTDNVENLTLTGDADLNGTGNMLNNSLIGNNGDNILDGGLGADAMSGGSGNDTYIVDNSGDVVVENAGEGLDTAQASINYTLGANVENLVLTGNGNINGTGNELNNVISGNNGSNVLDGGAGDDILYGGVKSDKLYGGCGRDYGNGSQGTDTMTGGTGDDTYIIDDNGNVIIEKAGEGIDTVKSSVTYTLGANVENLILTGPGNIRGTGNELNNVIISLSTSGNNILDGGAGDDSLYGGIKKDQLYGGGGNDYLDGGECTDTMAGGIGDDTYIVDNSGDVVIEGAGEGIDTVQASATYTLSANVENLTLTGNENLNGTGNTLNNSLIGNSGDNILNGGLGADTMNGGSGNDTYIVDNSGDVVVENAGEGLDTAQASINYTLGANVENLVLTGNGNINGTGNELNNVISGNSGNNILAGGAGDDTYIIGNSGDVVIENAGEGVDTVKSSVTYTLGANVENLTLTGNGNISGTGNELDNVITGNSGYNSLDGGAGADSLYGGVKKDQLYGGSGNDYLDGGEGTDTMAGGSGDDTYIVDNTDDVVLEGVGEGIDIVQSSATYILRANVENLTLTGTRNINGGGNELDNIIIGNAGNNALDGEAGNDSLYGGSDEDLLYGDKGNDLLDGGVDADIMLGGSGNDTYIVDNACDKVIESCNEGMDSVEASITYTLVNNVENLTLTGDANLNGTGNALNNILIGNDGNNVLNGKAGDDTLYGEGGSDSLYGGTGNDYLDGGFGTDAMYGGTGDDTYIVDNNVDLVVEKTNEGIDTVQASITYTLTANVDNLTLTGTAGIDGAGNGLNNVMLGNSGDNVLDGGAGADTMAGGLGNDTYIVDNNGDIVVEKANEGADTVQSTISYALTANVENLSLTGNADIDGAGNELDNVLRGNSGNNVLDGKAGNDYIDGGLGADSMAGGLDGDTYIVDNNGDLVSESAGEGIDSVQSSITYGLTANVENLALTGIADINGAGNELDNAILGNSGSNVIDGGLGADSMAGGLGGDTYIVDNSGDLVSENASGGVDSVQSSITYGLTANVENLTLTGTTDIDGTGNELDNTILGNSGDNGIDGGLGADTMAGGLGDDTYIVDNNGDLVSENAGEGVDSVQSSITYGLTANVENLTLTGTTDIDGTGNELDNTILGNSGDNGIDGGLGADTMAGGLGDDTYIVDNNGDLVSENAGEGVDSVQSSITYGLTANVENLTLTGTTDIDGTGNELDNTILGNSGDNGIDGGLGADTMAGGLGDDTYIVDNNGDLVSENADQGIDEVQSSITYTLTANAENLILTGSTNINGAGNALDNVITGNSGNNILDGGLDADTMMGGLGSDTYIVDNAGDIIIENSGQGTDNVQSSISYVLAANVENLMLTGTANINGTGNALNNTLAGNSGDNILDGGRGADNMMGNAGNDIYVVDNAGDSIIERADEGIDTVQSRVSYTLGANIENMILTGTGNINSIGNELDNILIGNRGNNLLNGGLGADAMAGGAGNDIYIVDNNGDIVKEAAGEGTDVVQSSITYTLTANVENLTLTGTANINGTGNELNNTIIGNSGNNILDGDLGADNMAGGAGNDIYMVDNSGDVVTEIPGGGSDTVQSSISYTLTANVENLILTGTANINGTGNTLNNSLTGNSGNNTLNAGLGADTMAGGAGNDTYVVDNTGDVVTENAAEGTDAVQSSISYTLGANVENLTLTGMANINGTGNELNNILTGNNGSNILDGGLGADVMLGGLGNDTYVVDNTGDVVSEAAGQGTDIVQSGISYILGANVENLTLTGAADINGAGNTQNNSLIGNGGNNVLNGDIGADTMLGGAGNDTYVVDNAGDVVSEAAGQGTDIVQSGISYILGANVENLILTGAANLNGTGNALDNILAGNSGANILDGGLGADVMAGSLGDDVYMVDNANDAIVEYAGEGNDSAYSSVSYTLGANIENLTLTGTAGINGTGNELNNVLVGNSGNNVLYGYLGSDTMVGGQGDDNYIVDNAGDVVAENAGEGSDTVQSGIGYTLGANVENLVLTGTAGINGTGNGLDNVLIGNSGNNVLDGGLGADTMAGGSGNDTYIVDNTTDAVVENAGEGADTVQASVTYTLHDNTENLVLTGTANINGTGNELNNVLVGNSGDNVLYGNLGADTMAGGLGNDTYIVDSASDTVSENANEGSDTILASISHTLGANTENLTLTGIAGISGTGNELNNILVGNNGDNVLNGGQGADVMAGGQGNDTYIVDNDNDIVAENAGEGIDTVQSSISYGLGANVENLSLLGGSDINGVGNGLNNTIYGNSGDNTLYGDAGDDYLLGGDGNDILTGSAGNDTLRGGLGDDIYTWGIGSGNDTIISYEGADNGFDRVLFVDLYFASLAFSATTADNDLVGTISQTGETIRFTDWRLGSDYQIKEFQFADGTVAGNDIQFE